MLSTVLFRFSKPNSCLIFLFFLSSFRRLSYALSQKEQVLCDHLFHCGTITAGFPFSGVSRPEACGHPSLVLHCQENTTSLIISGQMYQIFQIDNSSNTLRVGRQDFLNETFCAATFTGTTLTPELFQLSPDYKTLFVYYLCKPPLHNPANFSCPQLGPASVHQNNENHENCGGMFNITVPTSYDPEKEGLNLTRLGSVIRNGFEVKLKIDEGPCQECQSSGGICAYDVATPVCLLPSELNREGRRNLSGLKSLVLSPALWHTQLPSVTFMLWRKSVSFLYHNFFFFLSASSSFHGNF